MTAAINPDLPPYIDLTLLDWTEADLVTAMTAAIATRAPEWVPAEGDLEILLLEAWALATGQLLYAVNQIPIRMFYALGSAFGVPPGAAVQASASISVYTSGPTVSRTITAGQIFRVTLPDGSTVDCSATANVTGNAPAVLTVPVQLISAGATYNSIPTGSAVSPVDSLSWVDSVVTATAFTGGTDAEQMGPYQARLAAYLRRGNSALVTSGAIATAALDVAGVGRSKAIDQWDGISAVGFIGQNQGYVALGVATATGTAVASSVKTAIQAYFLPRIASFLTVNIYDPNPITITVTITVNVAPGYVASTVAAGVQAALTAYVSPQNRPWAATLSANDVVGVAMMVPGVAHVVAVGGSSVGAAAGVWDLPNGMPSITVTVA